MAVFARNELMLDKRVDQRSRRHFINDHTVVMHCHHYITLYSQLAMDTNETALIASVAEETFFELLADYCEDNDIYEIEEMIGIAEEYYAAMGLGLLRVDYLGEDSGKVTLLHSHVDDGWKKKWGQFDKPVNHITCGYIAAVFALINEVDTGSFDVVETSSIVMGADESSFNVVRK